MIKRDKFLKSTVTRTIKNMFYFQICAFRSEKIRLESREMNTEVAQTEDDVARTNIQKQNNSNIN